MALRAGGWSMVQYATASGTKRIHIPPTTFSPTFNPHAATQQPPAAMQNELQPFITGFPAFQAHHLGRLLQDAGTLPPQPIKMDGAQVAAALGQGLLLPLPAPPPWCRCRRRCQQCTPTRPHPTPPRPLQWWRRTTTSR